jgi:hypothetical protein
MLASKRISALLQLGRTNTDKRCSIAASAGVSSTKKPCKGPFKKELQQMLLNLGKKLNVAKLKRTHSRG